MNGTELKVKLMRLNMSVEDLANRMSINKATLYRKIKGDTQFDLKEVKEVVQILNLSESEMLSIFFNDLLA